MRRLTIDDIRFNYVISERYRSSSGDENAYWDTKLRVYHPDHKSRFLEIQFLSRDHYSGGNLLKSTIELTRKEEVLSFNIYRPGIVRMLIDEAIRQGWNWEETSMKMNGLSTLEIMGFGINELKP